MALTPDLPGDRAASTLCLRLLDAIQANLPGTLDDRDPEFLHDLRVAVRRTRSLQRELKVVFPPHELAQFRHEFRWLQQVTGPSRDLDVYLLAWDDFAAEVAEEMRGELEPLRTLLGRHRAEERERMEAALRSRRAGELLADWRALLDELPSMPIGDRPDAARPIGELAAKRIARVYREMVRMGEQIDADSPHAALHELRKKGKELRYLLEFFAPLFPAAVTKPMVKRLKALQNTLGRFQDREVQAAMIRDLGDELAQRADGPVSLMATGALIERLGEHQDEARAEFDERFAAFAAHEQRALMEQTFG